MQIIRGILRAGGMLPIGLKGRFSERLWSALDRIAGPVELETNMGIDSRIRFRTSSRSHNVAFGNPQQNRGERATIDLVLLLAPLCSAFLDVGANRGVFSYCVASKVPGMEVIAFEPDPVLHRALSANAGTGEIRFEVLAQAAGEIVGPVRFHRNLSDDNSGSLTNHFTSKHKTEQIEVEGMRLCDLLTARNLQDVLIKIDVEGAGETVWCGLKETQNSVEWLIMEIIGPEAEAKLPAQIIRDTGWTAYYICDYSLVHAPGGRFEYIPPFWNWLFCRESPEVLGRRIAGTKFEVIT